MVVIPNQRPNGESIEYGQACALSVGLIRLEQYGTDIIVSTSLPQLAGTFTPDEDLLSDVFSDKLVESRVRLQSVLAQFAINDWGLFVPDQS